MTKAGADQRHPKALPRRDRAVVTAVDRAAKVLWAFAESWDFLPLPDIAARARLSKATTFRILATLAGEGLVFQNEANGTYGLGFLTLRFADIVLGGLTLRRPAQAAMRTIRDAVNETVVLCLREGDTYTDVDSLEGSHMIAQSHSLGIPTLLDAGVPGRALLAKMSREDVAAYLRRTNRKSSVATRRRLFREISAIRRNGYAVSSGEFMQGGHTIAVAVLDAAAEPVAALHISFPQARFSNLLQDRCIEALLAGSRLISESINAP
jgi:DNA-binding IclR family transcriptional regulator